MAPSRAMTDIAFLFKEGRQARLTAGVSGPREFFYGYTEIVKGDLAVSFVEEPDLGGGFRSRWMERLATTATHGVAGLNAESMSRFLSQRSLSVLNQHRVIVATTNSQGLSLALARALGRLRSKVLLIAMGVLDPAAPALRTHICRRLLRHVAIAPISKGEEKFLRQRLGPDQDLAYLPFGVDHRFWVPPPPHHHQDDYVLSIGNDPRRDYKTLAQAWGPEFPPLKIITRLHVPPSPGNVEVIAGDWNSSLLSDQEIRSLIQGARFVVLPLRQTIQPSGQSVCLQAMACGKAVILSDIDGLWDRDVMVDGASCLLVPPGSIEGLQTAVQRLLGNPRRSQDIGVRARMAIEKDLNVNIMASAMERRLNELLERTTSN